MTGSVIARDMAIPNTAHHTTTALTSPHYSTLHTTPGHSTLHLLHHTTRATIGSPAFLGLLGSSIGTIRTPVEDSSQRLTCRRLTWVPGVGRDGGVAGDGRPSLALTCLPLGFCLVKFPRQTALCRSATRRTARHFLRSNHRQFSLPSHPKPALAFPNL